MSSFKDIFYQYNWKEVKDSIYSKTEGEVIRALNRDKRNLEDFKALISPAALPYLEQMAALSQQITQKRFGKTIQMYVPIYLSNECQNICTYCGFSLDNKIKRITLTEAQILKEIEVIKSFGYDYILLVTGESHKNVGIDYFKKIMPLFRSNFSHISMEVHPLEEEEYRELISLGLNTVLVYQETYDADEYKNYHLKGKKSNFLYRLETPDRLGRAGIHKIGLGTLIGLEDWRTDSFFTALHLNYLEKTYWQTKYSISFPRLRPVYQSRLSELWQAGTGKPAEGFSKPKVEMNEKELVQLICAYRIFDEEVELSISTREGEKFRDNIIRLGITSISAGSKTNPGGYALEEDSLEQFAINDERTPSQIAAMIKVLGYEPLWKDWDKNFI